MSTASPSTPPPERVLSSDADRVGTSNNVVLSDQELVRLVALGDNAAVELFVRRYDQLMYRTARAILKDDSEADDAVQEAFLLAHRGIAKFRQEARLSTWLVRIVANVSIARLRSGKRELRTTHLDDSDLSQAYELDDATPERPDEWLARSDTRRMIEAKIDALPDAYRLVFILRAVQELSVEETSEALGIPNATVRSRFLRARNLLRKSLAPHVGAFGDAFPFAGARCDRMVAIVMRQLAESAAVSPALV